jgi:quercetin dioxygenase-like cupin family protein
MAKRYVHAPELHIPAFWNGRHALGFLASMTMTGQILTGAPRVLGPADGQILGSPETVTDRFMINGSETSGRFAVVEHVLAPGVLAAPLHLHTKEDEYSYVLEGTVGAVLGGDEIIGTTGDLVFKPRGQWHTFWNAGDSPLRILEFISPGGLEELFRILGTIDQFDPNELDRLTSGFGCDADMDATALLVERHGLKF